MHTDNLTLYGRFFNALSDQVVIADLQMLPIQLLNKYIFFNEFVGYKVVNIYRH